MVIEDIENTCLWRLETTLIDCIKPRVLKAAYSAEWRAGKPIDREGVSHCVKVLRLESYEDALDNLELHRTQEQGELLQYQPGLREDYMLRYMLDVESRNSASLLDLSHFENPFGYTLKTAAGRGGEKATVVVDLVETFNFLLGLRVKHIDTIRDFGVVQGTNPQTRKC